MLNNKKTRYKALRQALETADDEQFTKADLIDMFLFSFNNKKYLNEATMRETVRDAQVKTKMRVKSQKLVSTYLGMTKAGMLRFKTTSGTYKGKYWYQEIYLDDLADVIAILEEDPTFKPRDAIMLAIQTGNIHYHCDDPSYKYFFQYVATKKNSALREEKRYPKIRNPRLEGYCCKHLLSCFSVLAFNWSRIIKDAQRLKLIPKNKASKRTFRRRLRVGK